MYVASTLTRFLGAKTLSDDGKRLVNSYFGLNVAMRTLFLITSTFYFLFILDLVGFATAGILISIGFIVQAVIDYPTGVLADWLGHRWVMFAAYMSHFVAFLLLGLTSILNPTNLFVYLIFVYVFESFALAQESGAMQAWFDNNYKEVATPDDPDRIIYRDVYGKTLMVLRFLGGIGIFVGGYLSDAFAGGREIVFLIQSVFMLMLAIAFLIAMKDYHENPPEVNISVSTYFKMLGDGFNLILKNRMLLYFTISFIVIIFANYVWVSLIVFPIYFGYTGSDTLASTLRTVLFITGSFITGVGATMSKKMDVKVWLPRILLFNGLFYYGLYAIILLIWPLPTDLNDAQLQTAPLIMVFVAGMVGNLMSTLGMLLVQRFMVDAVPDESRNSFYSLGPTLGLLISSLLVLVAGNFIESVELGIDIFSATIVIFIVIPLLIGAFFGQQAMRLYVPTEVVTAPHPHQPLLHNTTLFQLQAVFIEALPLHIARFADIRAVWEKFIADCTSHLDAGEEHKFIDMILEDLKVYDERFIEAIKDGKLTREEHEELGMLRNKILEDAREFKSSGHEVTEDEMADLEKLVELLHQHEHEITSLVIP